MWSVSGRHYHTGRNGSQLPAAPKYYAVSTGAVREFAHKVTTALLHPIAYVDIVIPSSRSQVPWEIMGELVAGRPALKLQYQMSAPLGSGVGHGIAVSGCAGKRTRSVADQGAAGAGAGDAAGSRSPAWILRADAPLYGGADLGLSAVAPGAARCDDRRLARLLARAAGRCLPRHGRAGARSGQPGTEESCACSGPRRCRRLARVSRAGADDGTRR